MSVIPYVENPPWQAGTGGGTRIDAADLNAIEQGITDAHLQPTCRAYHNTTQAITTGTATALAFNSERWDLVGGVASTQHDNSTNPSRLTCRFAGVYAVGAAVNFAPNATGSREVWFRVNATAVQFINHLVANNNGASISCGMTIGGLIQLAVNDYVEVFVQQASGGNLNINAGTSLEQGFADFWWARVG